MFNEWSKWRKFPNPQNGEFLIAPFGNGVYQLRNRVTYEYILFGRGKNVSYRMTSLLPKPFGQGTRVSDEKRIYVLKNINDIEYRTIALELEDESKNLERQIKIEQEYKFPK